MSVRIPIRWGSIFARDILLLLALTSLVVALTVTVQLVQLARVTLDGAQAEAELLGREVFALSRTLLEQPSSKPPAQVLRSSPALAGLLDAQVGYSRHVVYAAVAAPSGEPIAASEGAAVRMEGARPPDLAEVTRAGWLDRIRGLWSHDLYEVRVPLELDDEPFADVRLGVSTTLLRSGLRGAMANGMKAGGVALALALVAGIVFAGSTVRPIRRLRRQLGRMREGELDPEPVAGFRGEFEDLATDLHAFGRQVRAERLQLLAAKTSLEELVSHLEDPVLLLNTEREVLFANHACEEVLGTEAAEALGCSLHEVLAPEHPLTELVEQAARRGEPVRGVRLRFERGEGDRAADFLGSAFPVHEESGAPAGFVVLLEDLEAVEMVRSLIRYGSQMTSLKRLSAGMVHELKNPLHSLSLHVELLTETLAEPGDGAERSLRVLGEEIRRLDGLIEDFRRFSRPEQLRLEVLDLRSLVTELCDLVKPELDAAGIVLKIDLPEEPMEIDGDRERLRQALLNVVRNSTQAMAHGGELDVRVEPEPPLFARLSVRDTGPGIAPSDLERIFELYYSNKPGGSGFGLFLVHRIVREHGGMVTASSEPGEGTEIVFHLPLQGVLEPGDSATEEVV